MGVNGTHSSSGVPVPMAILDFVVKRVLNFTPILMTWNYQCYFEVVKSFIII